MMINADTIYRDVIIDPEKRAQKAQVGVDITVKEIFEFEDNEGPLSNPALIKVEGKTQHTITKPLETDMMDVFHLEKGKAYPVVFDQGLQELPPNFTAFIIQRSSLNRNGCRVAASVIDPGYGCKNLGATIYPSNDISIERHARIAQITVYTNEPVDSDNLYDGQYKGE